MIRHASSERLLFLSPWRPVESDTTPYEGHVWYCPNCVDEPRYFRSLARLEGAPRQFMVQCPICDHLSVIRIFDEQKRVIETEFGGPHIDHFISYLDARSKGEEDD